MAAIPAGSRTPGLPPTRAAATPTSATVPPSRDLAGVSTPTRPVGAPPASRSAVDKTPSSTVSTGPATGTTAARVPTGPARQISHGPRNTGNVALTFHGAGEVGYARQILQIAHSKNARITVMAVGTWLAQNPLIGREVLAGGHEIGNHTLSHVDINSLPPERMRAEVVGCRDVLLRTTGTPGAYFRQSQSQTANQRVASSRRRGRVPDVLVLRSGFDGLDGSGCPGSAGQCGGGRPGVDRQHASGSQRHGVGVTGDLGRPAPPRLVGGDGDDAAVAVNTRRSWLFSTL